MPEENAYAFAEFHLNPVTRVLLREGNLIPLTHRPFDMLLLFVRNNGRILEKDELIKWIWKETRVDDSNFHVTLHAVRKALGESGRSPRLIVKTGEGYRFVANVRQVTNLSAPITELPKQIAETERVALAETTTPDAGADGELPEVTPTETEQVIFTQEGRLLKQDAQTVFTFKKHTAHIVVSSTLYGSLFAVALVLEVAYKFDQFSAKALRIAPFVFCGMLATSLGALTLDRKLIVQAKRGALLITILIFLSSAAVLFIVVGLFLPTTPITQSVLQAYPAQAAYLKDEIQFIILAVFFMSIPFHSVMLMQRDIYHGRQQGGISAMRSGRTTSNVPHATANVWFWSLTTLLMVLLALSLAMTSRLLDHLKPGPYHNLFVQLVYLRGLLYFGLGIECVIWYYRALENIKRGYPQS